MFKILMKHDKFLINKLEVDIHYDRLLYTFYYNMYRVCTVISHNKQLYSLCINIIYFHIYLFNRHGGLMTHLIPYVVCVLLLLLIIKNILLLLFNMAY